MRKWIAATVVGVVLAFVLIAAITLWRMGIHLYDREQVPRISVGPGTRPVIAFEPAEAYTLHVYAGEQDGDGLDVLWTAVASGGYENNLRSPITYGVSPPDSEVRYAPPLEPGATYTVTVTHKDPKGGGDGFFNSRHRYHAAHTFVVRE